MRYHTEMHDTACGWYIEDPVQLIAYLRLGAGLVGVAGCNMDNCNALRLFLENSATNHQTIAMGIFLPTRMVHLGFL